MPHRNALCKSNFAMRVNYKRVRIFHAAALACNNACSTSVTYHMDFSKCECLLLVMCPLRTGSTAPYNIAPVKQPSSVITVCVRVCVECECVCRVWKREYSRSTHSIAVVCNSHLRNLQKTYNMAPEEEERKLCIAVNINV